MFEFPGFVFRRASIAWWRGGDSLTLTVFPEDIDSLLLYKTEINMNIVRRYIKRIEEEKVHRITPKTKFTKLYLYK